MHYVYVLKSLNSEHYYTGCTNNIESRIIEHNSGTVRYSSRYKPWTLIYSEKYTSKSEAFQREKYFKSHAGRNWLKKKFCLGS